MKAKALRQDLKEAWDKQILNKSQEEMQASLKIWRAKKPQKGKGKEYQGEREKSEMRNRGHENCLLLVPLQACLNIKNLKNIDE